MLVLGFECPVVHVGTHAGQGSPNHTSGEVIGMGDPHLEVNRHIVLEVLAPEFSGGLKDQNLFQRGAGVVGEINIHGSGVCLYSLEEVMIERIGKRVEATESERYKLNTSMVAWQIQLVHRNSASLEVK